LNFIVKRSDSKNRKSQPDRLASQWRNIAAGFPVDDAGDLISDNLLAIFE